MVKKSASPPSSNMTSTHLTLSSWRLVVRDAPSIQNLFMLEDWSTMQWLDMLHMRNRCPLRIKNTPTWLTGPCYKKKTPLCKESFNTFVHIAKPLFAQLATLQNFKRNLNYTANPSIAVQAALPMPMPTPIFTTASLVTSPPTLQYSANAKSETPSIQLTSVAPSLLKDTVTGAVKKVIR